MAQKFGVGQPVPRFEDPRLLTGGGRYMDDNTLPRETRAFILRSPFAHAKIKSIDVTSARSAPGVVEVLTGSDYVADGFGELECTPKRKRRDGKPMFEPIRRVLVLDEVKMVGDYVALVIAETLEQAKDAAELIQVEYDPLPSVSNPYEAAKPGAPKVWDESEDNICFVHLVGDKAATDLAIESAAYVVKGELPVNRSAHATMEPRGAIGDYDSARDFWTLYTAVHYPWQVREELCTKIFGIPENKMRVVCGDMGGSFGLRGGTYQEVVLVLWASKRVGRPVKWVCERSEGFMSDHHGRDVHWEGEIALDENYKFLGVRAQSWTNVGAYLASKGTLPPVANLGTMAGTYHIPAMHCDVSGVYTNTNPICPFRGNGRPEASYVIERLIDLAADQLEIDPAELRRRNQIAPEAIPYKTALVFTYDSGNFGENLEKALEMSDYEGFENRRKQSEDSGKLRGLGISNSIERAAGPSLEQVQISFDTSGTIRLNAGTSQQGQGHETIYKQIMHETLGVDPNDISFAEGDTALLAFGGGTGGSRSATIGGSAVLRCSEKIIQKAGRIAAHQLEAAEADIEFLDGIFKVVGTDRTISLIEVAKTSYQPGRLPPEIEPGLDAIYIFEATAENFPNGCHICEVEIDPETGVVEIVKYSVVDDVGTVLNPLTLKGQIQGGVVHGVGQALLEEIVFDQDSGQLVSGSFMDYAMPRADNLSYIEIESNPCPTATNPLGVKGAGEAGTVGAVPAVMNAVVDALSVFGIKHIDMPATPSKVWGAIQRAKSRAA
ncbi:MAG: xanthine dehydrogenase family protein molybdopterin-binding subunit [Rhodospirillaceae bacterium]